jgi:hypothetical protein
MAVKKISASRTISGKKKKPSRAAPGKADPGFLTMLAKAVQDEYRATKGARPKQATAAKTSVEAPARTTAARKSSNTEGEKASKTTATKRASKGVAEKGKGEKDLRPALIKELKAIIEELDEEGLDSLLEQAHVHRYNMEVEKLNDAEDRRLAREVKSGASTKKQTQHAPNLRIERSQDGNTYHVVSEGRYKMFSADEMLALVRIAHANPDSKEAARGLHRWMSRERSDALADLGVSGPTDPSLVALSRLIVKDFAKPKPGK